MKFLQYLCLTFAAVRKQNRIDALNEIIEQATRDRSEAKQRALRAQTERDALLAA